MGTLGFFVALCGGLHSPSRLPSAPVFFALVWSPPGKPPFEFLPTSDSETVIAELRMPVGTPVGETEKIVQRIESGLLGPCPK